MSIKIVTRRRKRRRRRRRRRRRGRRRRRRRETEEGEEEDISPYITISIHVYREFSACACNYSPHSRDSLRKLYAYSGLYVAANMQHSPVCKTHALLHNIRKPHKARAFTYRRTTLKRYCAAMKASRTLWLVSYKLENATLITYENVLQLNDFFTF